jgi:hypothetical protein
MPAGQNRAADRPDFRVGDLVEVRGAAEILATLDGDGELDSLPFMPEMLRYCGRQFRVGKVAHKLCDTIGRSGYRRMDDAVHLADVRCDGSAHGGCQAGCLMYWKTAWLKRAEPGVPGRQRSATIGSPGRTGTTTTGTGPNAGTTAATVDAARLLPLLTVASRGAPAGDGAPTYRCQSTEILRAAPDVLPARDLTQYVRDVRTGNVTAPWAVRALLVAWFNRLQDLSGRLPRWLRFRGGRRWGFLRGSAARTPTARTDLRPGELVRIRSKEEIMRTLNGDLLNRGLGFDAEMLRFCGRTARVARRVERIVDERTGRMRHMKNPCVVLEGIVCEGAYSLNCPRAIPAYWRELWLERVDDPVRERADVPD